MMKRILTILSILILGCSSAWGQIHETEDDRPNYKATFVIGADAHFAVKKMQLNVLTGEEILRDPYTLDTVADKAIQTALQQAAEDIAKEIIAAAVSESAASYVPYVGWAYTAGSIILMAASTENVKYRNYYIIAPAEGWYTFNVWVPGDVLQPASMIKIFSIDDSGYERQVYNYDQVAVSDRTIPVHLKLTAGLYHISVSIGSGTELTHTAGHLQSAFIDDTSDVTWTVPRVPITVNSVYLLNYLPNIGNSHTFTYNVVIPPKPSNIITGNVNYTNYQPLSVVLPNDATNTYLRIDVYGEMTDDIQAQLGTWPTIHMKAVQSGDPINLGSGGQWTLTRSADYTTNLVIKAIFHIVP